MLALLSLGDAVLVAAPSSLVSDPTYALALSVALVLVQLFEQPQPQP